MTTKLVNHCSRCNGSLEVVDASGHSITARCRACRFCSLIIEHPRISACITLADFHLKRGDGPRRRPLDDLRMATKLVRCLQHHWPLSPATIVDFGITTVDHFDALAGAVRAGVTAYDLDRVMGDGPAITRLVRSIPVQPDRQVEFATAYDGFHSWAQEADEI